MWGEKESPDRRLPSQVIPAQSHDYLPQSHTCFNTICLPPYESEDEVESRLLAAINSGAGFGVR